MFGVKKKKKKLKKTKNVFCKKNSISIIKNGGSPIMEFLWRSMFAEKTTGLRQYWCNRISIHSFKISVTVSYPAKANSSSNKKRSRNIIRKTISEWFPKNKVRVIERHSKLPDLNQMEDFLQGLEIAVHEEMPSHLNDMERICRIEWSKITIEK